MREKSTTSRTTLTDELDAPAARSGAPEDGLGSVRGHACETGRRLLSLRIRAKITRTVRILMIAPEPFFEPRGTPFSEYHRIRALHRARAHGRSRDLSVRPGRRRCRACACSAACGRRSSARVKIGPSLAKVPLDVAADAARRCGARSPAATTPSTRTRRAALIGVVLAALLGVPHLYDMHSSLPQQLDELRVQPLAAAARAVRLARAAA